MKKRVRAGLAGILVLVLALAGCAAEPPRPAVVLVGVDGASWPHLFEQSRAGRLPNVARLVARGSGGYVNSLLWRRFTHRRRGYFSPIVWSSVATGKRPDQHGVEDFVLPLPAERDFLLLAATEPGVLEVPVLHPGSLLLEGSAAGGRAEVEVEVRLDGAAAGRLSFGPEASVRTVPLAADGLGERAARIELRVQPPAPAGPAVRVRRLGLLDGAGRLVRWLHPRQNASEMPGAWQWSPPARGVPAASYHLLARPVWDIASQHGREVAVVGWWATGPAQPVRGTMISDWAGTSRRGSEGAALVQPPELLGAVERAAAEADALEPGWRAELAGALDCPCLGPAQSRVYLKHRREDEMRVRLAARLAADRPDLLVVYLRLIDAACHQFLAFEKPAKREACRAPGCDPDKLAQVVPGAYEIFDEQLGRLMQAVPDEAVWVLVSDHGQLSLDGKPGQHENNGFVLLAGPGVRPGLLFDAQVTDVAPTVLYLLDVPLGSDLPGRLLTQALEPGLLNGRAPRWVVSHEDLLAPLPGAEVELDEGLAGEQLEAIEALGYLD